MPTSHRDLACKLLKVRKYWIQPFGVSDLLCDCSIGVPPHGCVGDEPAR